MKKKKTSTQKSTVNPIFNEEIVFTNLKKEQLEEIVIKFTILHDSLTNRELLGIFLISSSSTNNEYIQWKQMIDGKKSNGWWHNLFSQILVDTEKISVVSSNLNINNLDKEKISNRNSTEWKLSKTLNISGFKINPLSILSYSNKTSVSDNP